MLGTAFEYTDPIERIAILGNVQPVIVRSRRDFGCDIQIANRRAAQLVDPRGKRVRKIDNSAAQLGQRQRRHKR